MRKSFLLYTIMALFLLVVSGCATTPSRSKITIYDRVNSDPPGATVYWGDKEDKLGNTGKTTPFEHPNTGYSPSFKDFYYQVKKEGFYDSEIIFQPYSAQSRTTNFTLKPKEAPSKVPIATANVRDISRITNDPNPEFWPQPSPDGKQLLLHVVDKTKKGYNAFSIVLINLGGAGRNLLAGPDTAYPSWYPNGKEFIYSYFKMDKPTLVKTPVQGVGMTFISPNPLGSNDQQAFVNPAGNKIAFTTKFGESHHVCTVNTDGSGFTVYVEGSSPRWSTDGKLIAFDRVIGKKPQIFVLNTVTGQVTQLTSGDSDNSFPVWSPDGEWLLFVSNRDGNYHLYVMKNDGTNLSQLTKGTSQEYFPAWSSDGYIYFSSDAGALESIKNPWSWSFSNIWRLKPVLK